MKSFVLILSLVLMLSVSGFAGEKFLGVKAGLASTSFEEQTEAASSLAIGVTLGTKVAPIIETGLEFSMLTSPWEFEETEFDYKMTARFTQTMVGVYAKVDLPLAVINPYVRAGLGYYMGKMEVEQSAFGTTESGSEDFKGAIGYNLGAGVTTFLGIYAEVVFHIVSRELDVDGAEAFGANNVHINAGYQFVF